MNHMEGYIVEHNSYSFKIKIKLFKKRVQYSEWNCAKKTDNFIATYYLNNYIKDGAQLGGPPRWQCYLEQPCPLMI